MVKRSQAGFTLVEIMVAISIFVIVATICIGALLTAHRVNQRAQAIKLAMDNINFALDSISIKMKRGSHYACANNLGTIIAPSGGICNGGNGVAFLPRGGDATSSGRTVYWLQGGRLKYKEYGSTDVRDIVADNITINKFDVSVLAANPADSAAPGEFVWKVPRAVMILEGVAYVGREEVDFSVQTTVSMRAS